MQYIQQFHHRPDLFLLRHFSNQASTVHSQTFHISVFSHLSGVVWCPLSSWFEARWMKLKYFGKSCIQYGLNWQGLSLRNFIFSKWFNISGTLSLKKKRTTEHVKRSYLPRWACFPFLTLFTLAFKASKSSDGWAFFLDVTSRLFSVLSFGGRYALFLFSSRFPAASACFSRRSWIKKIIIQSRTKNGWSFFDVFFPYHISFEFSLVFFEEVLATSQLFVNLRFRHGWWEGSVRLLFLLLQRLLSLTQILFLELR